MQSSSTRTNLFGTPISDTKKFSRFSSPEFQRFSKPWLMTSKPSNNNTIIHKPALEDRGQAANNVVNRMEPVLLGNGRNFIVESSVYRPSVKSEDDPSRLVSSPNHDPLGEVMNTTGINGENRTNHSSTPQSFLSSLQQFDEYPKDERYHLDDTGMFTYTVPQ